MRGFATLIPEHEDDRRAQIRADELPGPRSPMRVGGATLAGAAMQAGLVDEYTIVTHPVLVGSGTPFFTALDSWVNLNLVETRTFPGGVVMTRYETGRWRVNFNRNL